MKFVTLNFSRNLFWFIAGATLSYIIVATPLLYKLNISDHFFRINNSREIIEYLEHELGSCYRNERELFGILEEYKQLAEECYLENKKSFE